MNDFEPITTLGVAEAIAIFYQRIAMTCALPRWILFNEPEPLALVKVGCTALVRQPKQGK